MNEDVNTVSPTLGFIIKTIDFQGWAAFQGHAQQMLMNTIQVQAQHLGRWRSEDHKIVLEELFRED